MSDSQEKITETCDNLRDFLLEKNKRYGDSAITPLGIFSKTSSIEARLDDKLGRVKNSNNLKKNDVCDVLGYLVLLCVREGWTYFEDMLD